MTKRTMEQINLVVGILSKVWPYEESDEYGFVQGLFSMMHVLFSRDFNSPSFTSQLHSSEGKRKYELSLFWLCFSLSSYLYFLVIKKSLRLQVSDSYSDRQAPSGTFQPSLMRLSSLLNSVTVALERAAEDKSLLLNKIRNINELSRQEVDVIISMCARKDCVSSSDNIQKRRYIAMVEMCQVAGNRDQLITLLLPLAEQVLYVLLIHFQDSSYLLKSNETIKAITYGSQPSTGHGISSLCGKLLPVLQQLEILSEEKTGHNLKVFRRLVTSLKELVINNLSL